MKRLSSLTRLVKKRKVIGRGGDRGGTSGRGHKGQKARSGAHVGVFFEGGQMPLTRRLPKRGFSRADLQKACDVINLRQLESFFEADAIVTKETLVEKGLIQSTRVLVKILGDGMMSKKMIVHADAFSSSAAAAITSKGGEVHVISQNA